MKIDLRLNRYLVVVPFLTNERKPDASVTVIAAKSEHEAVELGRRLHATQRPESVLEGKASAVLLHQWNRWSVFTEKGITKMEAETSDIRPLDQPPIGLNEDD